MSTNSVITGIISRYESLPTEYFTSAVYPIFNDDILNINNPTISGSYQIGFTVDSLSTNNPTVQNGTLVDVIITYNDAVFENTTLYNPTVQNGTLVDVIITYNDAVFENTTLYNPTILTGTLV
jgi:hypothetical protein